MKLNCQIIAEVKTQSPFGFKSKYSWDELFKVAKRVGDIISIHTDPRWGGSLKLIKKARKLTNKPILAKGIHKADIEITDAIKAGANFVLVVGRLPNVNLDKCWIEPNSLAELSKLPSETKAVWNSRDLRTGCLKKETFKQAREIWDGWLCQASNIKTFTDIDPSANAVLVGSNLIEFANSIAENKML